MQTPAGTQHRIKEHLPDTLDPLIADRGWARPLPRVFVAIGSLLLCAALFLSRHWPLLHDAAIMHYVVFLMDHGWRPWADIIDINMPGSYMVEWFAVHLFGGGDLAWRLFDVSTIGVVIASATAIAPAQDRWAGCVGGLAVSLFHISNGPIDVGERDWFLMVFLLAGSAFYLDAMRRRRPAGMFAFAALTVFAAAIKPPAAVFPCALLALGCFLLRRRKIPLASYLRYTLAGAMMPVLLVAGFLLRYHNLHAFLTVARGLVPFYASHGNHTLAVLLRVAFTPSVPILAVLAGSIAVVSRSWESWESRVLLTGFAFGALLYLVQGKGWQYHKETMFAFLLIWITIQFSVGLRTPGSWRWVAVSGSVLLCLLMGRYVLYVQQAQVDLLGTPAMQASLQQQGGSALSGDVQCVEMVSGCIHALYNLKLLPSNGFIFDSFLFTPAPTPAIEALRLRFLGDMQHKVPRVVIVAESEWNDGISSFKRIDQWAAFHDFLQQHYRLDSEHDSNGRIVLGSYRVYVRK